MKKVLFILLFIESSLMPLLGELFISEYIEGSSYNKALEIYNPGPDPVDLAEGNYVVEVYFNGKTVANMTIELSGIIASKDVYVIAPANIKKTSFPADEVDLFFGIAWFNGDDTVVLKRNSEIIDSLGQLGFDPGSAWKNGDVSTANHSLRRKASVTRGDIIVTDVFNPSVEWEAYSQDDFSGLGAHR